jgi:AmmeMemoRadiSam system protein A
MAEVYLPLASQKKLIGIARQTLDASVRGQARAIMAADDPYLEQRGHGAFVTLFKQDELRGCIGTCTPSNSLRQTVVEMTEAASKRDPRMRPVSAEELGQIHIDISVLSPLSAAAEPMSLTVGRHGLHIASGRKRGLLLPQVAVEHRWDMLTFLQQTCLKAELPKDAWSWPDTVVSAFTALIINEATSRPGY